MTPSQRRDETGIALIATLVILVTLFAIGIAILTVSSSAFSGSRAYSGSIAALHIADSGIEQVVAKQADTRTAVYPKRFIFNDTNGQTAPDPKTYVSNTIEDSPHMVDLMIVDPVTTQTIGRAARRVIGPDPRFGVDPPYLIESIGYYRKLDNPATNDYTWPSRTVRALVKPISLLEYAVYSEGSVTIGANLTVYGKVYSGGTVNLSGPGVVLHETVEYVTGIANPGNGTFNGDPPDLLVNPAYPSISSQVDLLKFKNASQAPRWCGDGIGLYIGPDANHRHNKIFERNDSGWRWSAGVVNPPAYTPGSGYPAMPTRNLIGDDACRDSAGPCYQIDLTLFDFSGPTKATPTAITYNGVPLKRYDDGQPLINFNGVLFVDGELHVWGINGGRSIEDFTGVEDRRQIEGAGPGLKNQNCNIGAKVCGSWASRQWYERLCYPGPPEPLQAVELTEASAGAFDRRGMNLYSNNRLDDNSRYPGALANLVGTEGEDGRTKGCPQPWVNDAAGTGCNGGTAVVNQKLDPRGLGQSLTIVTGPSNATSTNGRNLYIDHNIFMGQTPDGRPVRMALISAGAVIVDKSSPRTTHIQAAILGRGEKALPPPFLGSFYSFKVHGNCAYKPVGWSYATCTTGACYTHPTSPCHATNMPLVDSSCRGSDIPDYKCDENVAVSENNQCASVPTTNNGETTLYPSHQFNYWARDPHGNYYDDVDWSHTPVAGTDPYVFQTDNLAVRALDENETAMGDVWAITNYGNIITRAFPDSGCYSHGGTCGTETKTHIRSYLYDPQLLTVSPPCYPVQAAYGVVPGSWQEVK